MKKTVVIYFFIINSLFFPLSYADVRLTAKQVNTTINQLDQITKLMTKAEQGDMSAQYKLAEMYYFGLNIDRNYTESKKWYTLAAQQGHVDAQLFLAYNYYTGRDREKIDYEEALK